MATQKKIARMEVSNLTIEQAYYKYISEKIVSNVSKETIRSSNDSFNRWSKFIDEEGYAESISNVTSEYISDFSGKLLKEQLRPASINHYIRHIRAFLYWYMDKGIPISGSMFYMCAVLDLCGKVVLAWKIGSDMSSSLVTDTIREALKQEKVTDGLALHSDQGSQYTSKAYFDLTQEYHVSPSMSSLGCPYDNAAMENFFGTLKPECLYHAHFSTLREVEQIVSEYVNFYNFERISLKNGLTSIEIRCKTA